MKHQYTSFLEREQRTTEGCQMRTLTELERYEPRTFKSKRLDLIHLMTADRQGFESSRC